MTPDMDIIQATRRYERWMDKHTVVVKPDLRFKHEQMRTSMFAFLRATFYRWAEIWPSLCPDACQAPVLLSVGDLHIENFGTWRDAEGRLIWGINDFDEAYPLPYTNDLIRLATSAHVAIKASHLGVLPHEACGLILQGYRDGLAQGGRPYVLDEDHPSLRSLAFGELRDPVRFWQKIRIVPTIADRPSGKARRALELLLPERDLKYEVKRRRSGLGSLGRQRFVALAEWRGGPIAREIKVALPSACILDRGSKRKERSFYSDILSKAIRVPDPFVRFHEGWIVRRLAPDCSRIELAALPARRDEEHVLHAMGFETANVHLGCASSKALRKDLDRRRAHWLHEEAKTMVKALAVDWKAWMSART
jgi:hypothetical protein